MKKTIAILLVAIMAVGSAFAAFSGSAQVGVGANFDNGDWGFIGNETKVTFDVDLATMNAEDVSEGDIYASIKGSLGLRLVSDQDGIGTDNPFENTNLATGVKNGYAAASNNIFGVYGKIDEAKIAGANWYVSLKGVADVNDFAKSAIDTWTAKNDIDDDWGFLKADYDKNATWKVGYVKAPGVEVGIYDFVVGIGFKAEAVQEPELDLLAKKSLTLYAKTPEIAIIDGLTIQAGATYATEDAGYVNKKTTDVNAFGVSAKVAYASDLLSASVATDMGYDIEAEEFGADIAANVTYDFVGVDFYYATAAANSGADGYEEKVTDPDNGSEYSYWVDYKDDKNVEDLLSLQAKLDLTGFNVPVGLTLKGKDLVNAQDLSATVDLTFGSFKVSPTVGYVVEDEEFKAGVAVEYACDYFTAKAETNIKTAFENDDLVWDASASIENATLIPGATIKLAWTDGDNLLGNRTEAEHGQILASLKLDF